MISLLSVVKNEERDIGKMLSSVKGIVSEKLIIDTGSMDRTVEICRDLGCVVLVRKQKWRDNLVLETKNIGLKHVVGEWIICLDGDEQLSEELKAEMLEFSKQNDYDCLRVTRLNFFRDRTNGTDRLVRMFRNNTGYRFVSIYNRANHEQPFILKEGQIPLEGTFGRKYTTSNKLFHWGWAYITREEYLRKKSEYGDTFQKGIAEVLDEQFKTG